MAECLPDPSAVGGESLATAILEMAHQPSAKCGRWGRIQGDIPGRDQADIMFVEAPDGKDDHRKVGKHRSRPGFVVAPWIIEAEVEGGIRIDGTQEKARSKEEVRTWTRLLPLLLSARPVAQYSANTPRHDSSTSDFMKLQTMGGPPEELRDGLLDDPKRQSSRTNSTRAVASTVPV
ncbi:unnamed protein product [Arctogadus glacialis]